MCISSGSAPRAVQAAKTHVASEVNEHAGARPTRASARALCAAVALALALRTRERDCADDERHQREPGGDTDERVGGESVLRFESLMVMRVMVAVSHRARRKRRIGIRVAKIL